MAENTNVIKEIKIGTEAHPIGVDWENVEGNPTLPWSKITAKPTFTWDSKNSTLTINIP